MSHKKALVSVWTVAAQICNHILSVWSGLGVSWKPSSDFSDVQEEWDFHYSQTSQGPLLCDSTTGLRHSNR